MNPLERAATMIAKTLDTVADLLPGRCTDATLGHDYDTAVDPVFNKESEPMEPLTVPYHRWLPGDPSFANPAVKSLGPEERDRRWVSDYGTHWKFENGVWWHTEPGHPKVWVATPHGFAPETSGPFTELTAQPMDWLGWAVPAILDVLGEHGWRPKGTVVANASMCRCGGEYDIEEDWRNHVAPLIAERIGCDPQRAIEVLSNYTPKAKT